MNHETAPVEVREHFAVPVEQQGERANELTALSTIAEGVVLSTCNRTEVYVAAENIDMGISILRDHLAKEHDHEALHHLYAKSGDDAKRHLFSLVCGLDSMVLGETEIFGQVKQAYKQALEAGATKG
ncbi:MAG: glutamyl-tRNA reductase, partial [Verrucomicrobiae bacterium]|nr:glutamyl-tRNA reductase [Verrucomicrobiae bacterium]